MHPAVRPEAEMAGKYGPALALVGPAPMISSSSSFFFSLFMARQIEMTIELEEDTDDFTSSLLEMSQAQSRVYLVYAKCVVAI